LIFLALAYQGTLDIGCPGCFFYAKKFNPGESMQSWLRMPRLVGFFGSFRILSHTLCARTPENHLDFFGAFDVFREARKITRGARVLPEQARCSLANKAPQPFRPAGRRTGQPVPPLVVNARKGRPVPFFSPSVLGFRLSPLRIWSRGENDSCPECG